MHACHIHLPFTATVKNQGRWVMHFIREMEKVYQVTGDKNFNVIIVDFNSTDIDIEQELKNAILPRYGLYSLKEKCQQLFTLNI